MGWFLLTRFLTIVLELIFLGRQTDVDKDLEILLLRRQPGILERKQVKPLQLSRAEKWTLMVLLVQLKLRTAKTLRQLRDFMCLAQPETVLKWHLRRVMLEYIDYYNTARPHQGIKQRFPVPKTIANTKGPIRCRRVLGGIIRDYQRVA